MPSTIPLFAAFLIVAVPCFRILLLSVVLDRPRLYEHAMVLGSPSTSVTASLVFWSGDDTGPSVNDTGAEDAGNVEANDCARNGQSMYVTIFEGVDRKSVV